MAYKPYSLRQLEDEFLCQCRYSGDEMVELWPEQRPARPLRPRTKPNADRVRRPKISA